MFGPNKLPDVAKQAGKAFQELRRVQQHLLEISALPVKWTLSDLDGSSQSASAPSGDPVPMLSALDSDAAPAPESGMPPPSHTTPPAADPPPPSSPPPADPA